MSTQVQYDPQTGLPLPIEIRLRGRTFKLTPYCNPHSSPKGSPSYRDRWVLQAKTSAQWNLSVTRRPARGGIADDWEIDIDGPWYSDSNPGGRGATLGEAVASCEECLDAVVKHCSLEAFA